MNNLIGGGAQLPLHFYKSLKILVLSMEEISRA